MLRIDRDRRSLTALPRMQLRDAGLRERNDLQQMIRNCPEAFFGELGETLLLMGEEVKPASPVDDRIDLLALDTEGCLVVIELKRGSHKLQLLQALGYAGMVSDWSLQDCVALRGAFAGVSKDKAGEEIEAFLEPMSGTEAFNARQRIVLVAEEFEYEVLVAAHWLTEHHGVDIRCYRADLSVDGDVQFLSCACVYPPKEIAEIAVARGRGRSPREGTAEDWTAMLDGLRNADLREFFEREVSQGRRCSLSRKRLLFPLAGRPLLRVSAKSEFAYVWQAARFGGDEEFWRQRLGVDIDLSEVADGTALRFYLKTGVHFQRFCEAAAEAAQRPVDSEADV